LPALRLRLGRMLGSGAQLGRVLGRSSSRAYRVGSPISLRPPWAAPLPALPFDGSGDYRLTATAYVDVLDLDHLLSACSQSLQARHSLLVGPAQPGAGIGCPLRLHGSSACHGQTRPSMWHTRRLDGTHCLGRRPRDMPSSRSSPLRQYVRCIPGHQRSVR